MELKLMALILLAAGILFSGCTSSEKSCSTTQDCPKDAICLNETCSYPPVCRESNELCANSSDCCPNLACANYRCG